MYGLNPEKAKDLSTTDGTRIKNNSTHRLVSKLCGARWRASEGNQKIVYEDVGRNIQRMNVKKTLEER